jgi:hypothetical protein
MKLLRFENLEVHIQDDADGVSVRIFPVGVADAGDAPLAECEATFDDATTIQEAVGVPVLRTGEAVMTYDNILYHDANTDKEEVIPEGTEGVLTRILCSPCYAADGWVTFPGIKCPISVNFSQIIPVY